MRKRDLSDEGFLDASLTLDTFLFERLLRSLRCASFTTIHIASKLLIFYRFYAEIQASPAPGPQELSKFFADLSVVSLVHASLTLQVVVKFLMIQLSTVNLFRKSKQGVGSVDAN